jgi:uncharacterized membrane protein
MSNTLETEVEAEDIPKKPKKVKAIIWAIVFALTAMIYLLIPTHLIITYWVALNNFTFQGKPAYTFALLMLFLYIIAIILAAIYVAAMFRAIYQRKNTDLGIPKGVQWWGAMTCILIIGFMIFWFFYSGGDIAFFVLRPP